MFSATLYHNYSDNNVFNKNIVSISDVDIVPTEMVNIIQPVFELDYNSNVFSANYIYAPFFQRYYYIISHAIGRGKKIYLTCLCDTLMSYHDEILTADICVVRSENPVNRNLTDDKIPVSPKEYWIETNPFPNNPYSYGGRQYVIAVNGTEVI